MRFAMILNNKAHWIFEQDTVPNFPPDSEGNPIIVVNITDKLEVQESWDYDFETGEFTEPTVLPQSELEPVSPTLPIPSEKFNLSLSDITTEQRLEDIESKIDTILNVLAAVASS
jgi:hypothetical protein